MNRFTFKILFIFTLIAFSLISGCRIYSWMVLENPEFPDDNGPAELKPEFIDKYTVGDVIVQPRIVSAYEGQGEKMVFVRFFSQNNSAKVSIKNLSLSFDGEDIEYIKNKYSYKMSEWESYMEYSPFFVCHIISDSFAGLVGTAHISMVVTVTENSGKIETKKIEADFVLRKMSYIE